MPSSTVQREKTCVKGREKSLWERPEAGSLHLQNMEVSEDPQSPGEEPLEEAIRALKNE